ncbi:MAG: hypothetical protein ACPGJJ_03570, partial [Parvibaculales bacterium]
MQRLPFLLIMFSLVALPVSPLAVSSALAEEAKKEKPQKPKTRRSQVLGKSAFRLIEKTQELMGEEKFEEAMQPLQTILDGDKFNPYEKAVAIQTMGYIYAGKEDYDATIASFERAIATGDLPPRVVSDLTYG